MLSAPADRFLRLVRCVGTLWCGTRGFLTAVRGGNSHVLRPCIRMPSNEIDDGAAGVSPFPLLLAERADAPGVG
jgi:hypothetical protein